MQRRPTSLTVIGWFLIVMAAFGLIGIAMMQNNPVALSVLAQSSVPLSVHIAVGLVGSLIGLVSGYGVLKGQNWTRFVYLGWVVVSQIFNIAVMPFSSLMLFGLALSLLIIFFLFRPAANAWFAGSAAAANE